MLVDGLERLLVHPNDTLRRVIETIDRAELQMALVVDEGRVAFDGAPAAAIAHYRELSGVPAASGAASGRPSPDDPARDRP